MLFYKAVSFEFAESHSKKNALGLIASSVNSSSFGEGAVSLDVFSPYMPQGSPNQSI